ncbi:MAG TPA: secretin N-terminal domain-containing protein [Steroidobacteraceae bacterium]|nr:secretin N-terminal domain-containing protein [Steroidobacteraceae bacterium]
MLVLLALICSTFASAQSLEVIQLKYRTADEVIPVLQPMLESGAVLTGKDYQLFVRTSPTNLQQLRQTLAQIDRAPRNLLVSVREATRSEIHNERIGASMQAGVQNRDGAWRTQGKANVQAENARSRTARDDVSSVRLLEGGSAFISTGASVPRVTAVFARKGARGIAGGAALEYQNVSSGFAVTPRVNGERVVLEIDQQSQQLEGGAIRSQALGTQVAGVLGEWIELGGVMQSEDTREHGIASGRYSTNSDARTLWVKVEAQ